MGLSRHCVTFAVLLIGAHAVTPMEKVLSLLEGLKKEVEEEGKAEATTYGKFACFCNDGTKTKSKSIVEGQDKIDVTVADIGKKTATKAEKITTLGKEQQKVEDTTKLLAKTTATYVKDKATYESVNADLTKAVSSAKKAHKALSAKKGAAAFLDFGNMKSDVSNCLDLAEAMGMVEPTKHEAVTSFLQVDPNDPAYKFHSTKILKIIEDLRADFQKQKDTVNKDWAATDKSFKAEKKSMEAKIATAKKEIKTLNGEIDDLKSKIAQLKTDLVTTTASLSDDSAYLRDLTVRCQEKGEAWDQRTKTRNGEVEALTKALSVLNKKAKDNAKAVNKRALLLAKPVAAPVKAAAPKAAAKATAKVTKPAAKKALSFLQAGAQRGMSMKRQQGAAAVIRQESVRLGSTMLSSLAAQIEADPFGKIKKLIQGLIERLLTESKNEATKKGFCDEELGKSELDRKNRFADINKVDAELSELEAKKNSLDMEIKELISNVKDLKADLKKATELRTEEKAENAVTLKKAEEGSQAVGEALVILKDFYSAAAKEFVQVDASPIDEKGKANGGFDSSYKGSQGSSKAILGLLETIKSDFERTLRKTEAAETKAHEEFTLFDRSSKADIAGKETKTALDKQDLASTISAIDDGMKDLKTASKRLDAALKTIEDLAPTCIDTGMSFKERTAKREEEMKALEKALCKLDTDKVEAECK